MRTLTPLSYRDDHAAAIARIATLEQELTKARRAAEEQAQRDAARIAMLEREIEDLRRHAATAEAPGPARPDKTGPGILRTALRILAEGVFGGRPSKGPPSDCSVRSVPPGVRVFGVCEDGREVDLGTTPVELSFHGWRAYRTLKLRAPGYAELATDAPYSAKDAPREPYVLVRS